MHAGIPSGQQETQACLHSHSACLFITKLTSQSHHWMQMDWKWPCAESIIVLLQLLWSENRILHAASPICQSLAYGMHGQLNCECVPHYSAELRTLSAKSEAGHAYAAFDWSIIGSLSQKKLRHPLHHVAGQYMTINVHHVFCIREEVFVHAGMVHQAIWHCIQLHV